MKGRILLYEWSEFRIRVVLAVDYSKYLLTESKVPESVCLRFSYRPCDEGAKYPKGKYFPIRTEQTRLVRKLLHGSWLVFFLNFN